MTTRKPIGKENLNRKPLDFFNSTAGAVISLLTAVGIGVSIGAYAGNQQGQFDRLQNYIDCERKVQFEKDQYRELEGKMNKERVEELSTVIKDIKKGMK